MARRLWGILFIIILIFIGINYKSILKTIYPIQFESIVTKYSAQYKINPYRVYSLIKVESKFNPYAKSNKGATGLMQITPSTGKYISKLIGDSYYSDSKLLDPETNIRYGCFYFGKLLNDFDGDVNCAIAAYNGGEGNVRKWIKKDVNGKKTLNEEDIPFSETRSYIKRVNKYFKIYNFVYKQ